MNLDCEPQQQDEDATEAAAVTTTNPFVVNNKIELQASYTRLREGGNAATLLVRLALVYRAFFIPGLKVSDLVIKPFAWGLHIGGGIAAILPTATDPVLDTRELQLGPSFGAMVTRVKHLEIGFLAHFLFSVAGENPNLAYVQFQPIITVHPGGRRGSRDRRR